MEQELIKPAATPTVSSQAFGPLGCLMAAFGVTLLALCLWGAAFVTTIWALCRLLGLPDSWTQILMLVGIVPAVAVTIWTAGRSWHVETLLAKHQDIDTPVFKLFYYFRKPS